MYSFSTVQSARLVHKLPSSRQYISAVKLSSLVSSLSQLSASLRADTALQLRHHVAVNRPREQAKDSEVFCSLAASGVEQAKKLAAGAKVCCLHIASNSHEQVQSHTCIVAALPCASGSPTQSACTCNFMPYREQSNITRTADTNSRQYDALLAVDLQSRTAKDVIRRLKYRFASEAQADVEEDPTSYDWVAAGDHCLHLFGCAVGKYKPEPAAHHTHPCLSTSPIDTLLHTCASLKESHL